MPCSFRSMKNCGNAVQNALRQVDGVDSAIVDFPSRLATVVVSDPSVDGAQLCDAVEMIGFDASLKASHQAPTVPSTIPLRIGGMSWYVLRSTHMASAVLCCCSRCCAPAPTPPHLPSPPLLHTHSRHKCATKVTKALEAVAGVTGVTMDFANKLASVSGTAPPASLVAAVVAAGYTATAPTTTRLTVSGMSW